MHVSSPQSSFKQITNTLIRNNGNDVDIYGDDTAHNNDDADDIDVDDDDDNDDDADDDFADDIDVDDDDDIDDAADNDDDGNCLGWSLSPTQSVCLTVALLKHSYCMLLPATAWLVTSIR